MGAQQLATTRPNAQLAKQALEHVLHLEPDHPGACHLYIHLMEASGNSSKALRCADALVGPARMPGSPHMNHLPSHIFIHSGRYQEGAEANRRAIAGAAADALYPMHNREFLVWLLRLQGNSTAALAWSAWVRGWAWVAAAVPQCLGLGAEATVAQPHSN